MALKRLSRRESLTYNMLPFLEKLIYGETTQEALIARQNLINQRLTEKISEMEELYEQTARKSVTPNSILPAPIQRYDRRRSPAGSQQISPVKSGRQAIEQELIDDKIAGEHAIDLTSPRSRIELPVPVPPSGRSFLAQKIRRTSLVA